MTLFSKDHYELIERFDRIFKGSFRLDKEDKSIWSQGNIYQNGEANTAFQAFRHGYAFGRAVEHQPSQKEG